MGNLDAQAMRVLSLMDRAPPTVKLDASIRASVGFFDAPLALSLCQGGEIFPDVKPPDVGWKIDQGVLFLGEEYAGDFDIQIQRLKSTSYQRVRGLIDQRFAMLPGIYEYGVMSVFKGRTWAHRHFFGYANSKWRMLDLPRMSPRTGDGVSRSPFGDMNSDVDTVDAKRMEMIAGLQFTAFYHWKAVLSLGEENMRVGFFVSPAGLRELFRLRDVPEGAKRRTALLHWVSGHSRRISDGDDVAWVRKHLRGATKFNWGSLYGEIVPSRDAVREAETEKAVRR